ncbi:Gtp-binding protein parf partner of arf [Fasciola gigantica]|uniref:Gtp-binding protein parf partner of arf n=1 Tax=Fasciola gigantica TaxID=46835 RepID=A0A504Z0H8_FASGI|nr:Gtp-binding protein parf partner of arf [Fasciola gigantica]
MPRLNCLPSLPRTRLQVACIHWGDRKYTDVVKVEVWDVIDKGKPRTSSRQGLKFKNSDTQNTPEPCLDASFLDVYKGAHGVILVMDMTKSWTFDYVRRELPRIPPDLPVLILSNCRDMGHHRTVSEEEVRGFIKDEAAGRVTVDVANSVRSKRSVLQQQLKETQIELEGTVRDLSLLDGALATTDEAYNT